MNQPYHIHLISDSTGETVSSLMRSVMAQFEKVETQEHVISLIRTKGQMERAIEGIKEHPGIVLYTIMDDDMQAMLKKACKELNVPCVNVLSRVMRELTNFFGVEAAGNIGRQYELDDDYFSRVDAINYTLAHDDGQLTDDLHEADIVLVGVSRTSKTPTCVYLSYRGLYAANIPFVKGVPLPENLFELKNTFIMGLVISPDRLVQIRKSRLLSLHEQRETSYVDIDFVKEEVLEAKRLFTKNGWPFIDVTRKSVEETCALIMQKYQKYKDEG